MAPSASGTEEFGLSWTTEKTLALWMVYRLPNALFETLSHLLELVFTWALEIPKLIILGAFNVHFDDPASSQAVDLLFSKMVLGCSKFFSAPENSAGHMLDLIFATELSMILEQIKPMP